MEENSEEIDEFEEDSQQAMRCILSWKIKKN
jgi:hypothetical protein